MPSATKPNNSGSDSGLRVELPALHVGQEKVLREAKRFNVLNMGRRWGKSLFLRYLVIIKAMVERKPVGWFSPNNKILADSWREMKASLNPVITEKREDDHRVELVGGGSIEMWSLESEDAGRSRKYALVVVDEAAMVAELKRCWEENILPTLADYEGPAWFASTPKGMNYYKSLYDHGLDPDPKWVDWMSWKMPTITNPYISTKEIEMHRSINTEAAFSQEYLAEFVNWEGSVFRNVDECAVGEIQKEPLKDHEYVFGVDWGRSSDYTVITVIDKTARAVVAYDRFSQVNFNIQRDRLRVARDKWKPKRILAESNSIGEPVIEQLESEGIPIDRFVTSNQSKDEAIRHLALAFERQSITVPKDRIYIDELVAFQGKLLPSGMMRYSAPEGLHDDIVMSLAVGWTDIADGNRYGALEFMKQEYNLMTSPGVVEEKLIAKVATSSVTKPVTGANTNHCPSCEAKCIIKIGWDWKCNSCGHQWLDVVLPPNKQTDRYQFVKGAKR